MRESLTVGADVVALSEQTETITTGSTTKSSLQNTGQRASVGSGDVVGVGGLVAAGDLGVITALGLSLLNGGVLLDGELDVAAVSSTDTVTRALNTVTSVRHGQSSGGEEKSGSEELHFDGVGSDLVLAARSRSKRELEEREKMRLFRVIEADDRKKMRPDSSLALYLLTLSPASSIILLESTIW